MTENDEKIVTFCRPKFFVKWLQFSIHVENICLKFIFLLSKCHNTAKIKQEKSLENSSLAPRCLKSPETFALSHKGSATL